MSEPSTESVAPNILWDITRYVIVAGAAGFMIWWYFIYTPTVYVYRDHTGKTMGTSYAVKVAQFPENGDWQKVTDEIQARLDALDKMMSTYQSESEVCRFNDFASTEDWFEVSQEIAKVVHAALEISRLSEGAFDLTDAPPGVQAGYEKLSVRFEPKPALKKTIPELTINLSALAKGFAVDCIAELLDAYKITDYWIEIDDTVRSKGKKSKDKDWIVGIEKPSPAQFLGIHQTFPLQDMSWATSGCYPLQMGTSTEKFASVAVIAPHCMQAHAWTAAMHVLGEQKGQELANRHNIAVLFLLRTGDDIREIPSKHWMQ
ncbi:MAG: FAD:protein FMN transferase [Planctomycetaceae bacterium]|nr:FAD:protein FMN transferase [Planctomycetaceae bacterium]